MPLFNAHMAIFTTTDRDNVKTALITAATTGFASVSVAGQSVQTYALDQLRSLLKEIQNDLASGTPSGSLRFTKLIPPGGG